MEGIIINLARFEKLLNRLKEKKATFDDISKIDILSDFFISNEINLDMLRLFGLSLKNENNFFYLSSVDTNIKEQEFCFVDIETNGSDPKNSQIIEIAAIKTRGTDIIDTFESLIYCDSISDAITDITGLNVQMLSDKPSEEKIMQSFRAFLGGAIFVAHNVDFDFGFISKTMQKYSLPPLLNIKLCTIDLAKKTIVAEKYGLKSLAEVLNLEGFLHHRAYSDSMASFEIFKHSLAELPECIIYAQELVDYSKNN